MKESDSLRQEGIDEKLIEDISHINNIALGEGAVTCQVCGTPISEGDAVFAYAFRPADKPTYQIGYLKCIAHRHSQTEHFTLGVRELVVKGRVGRCVDQARQSWWPILLEPEIRAISAEPLNAGRLVGGRGERVEHLHRNGSQSPNDSPSDDDDDISRQGRLWEWPQRPSTETSSRADGCGDSAADTTGGPQE